MARELYRITIVDGTVSTIEEKGRRDIDGPLEVVITLRPTDDPLDALAELIRMQRRSQEATKQDERIRRAFERVTVALDDDKAGA